MHRDVSVIISNLNFQLLAIVSQRLDNPKKFTKTSFPQVPALSHLHIFVFTVSSVSSVWNFNEGIIGKKPLSIGGSHTVVNLTACVNYVAFIQRTMRSHSQEVLRKESKQCF